MKYARFILRCVGCCCRVFHGLRRHFFLLAFVFSVVFVWVGRSIAEEQDDPSYFEQGLRLFFEWLVCHIIDLLWPQVMFLVDNLPVAALDKAESLAPLANAANGWIALDYAGAVAFVMVNFLLLYFVIRSAIKLVPTVG